MTRTMVKESLVVCTLPSGYSRCHFTPSNTTINLINLLAETPIYREIVSVVISTGKQTNEHRNNPHLLTSIPENISSGWN